MFYIEVPLYKRALIDTGFRSVWCSALLFNLSGFFCVTLKTENKVSLLFIFNFTLAIFSSSSCLHHTHNLSYHFSIYVIISLYQMSKI